jgi:hypothetical protein
MPAYTAISSVRRKMIVSSPALQHPMRGVAVSGFTAIFSFEEELGACYHCLAYDNYDWFVTGTSRFLTVKES